MEAHIHEETLGASRSLVLWGMTNFFTSVLFLFLTPIINVPDITKYHYFSILMFLASAHSIGKVPLRVPFPMVMLLVLQLWYCITSMYANVVFARDFAFVLTYYHPLGCVLAFLNAAATVYLDGGKRRIMINTLGAVVALSAVVGIGQFLNIGPFVALGAIAVKAQETRFLQETQSMRAPGILAWGHGTLYTLVLMGTSMTVLLRGKLRPGIVAFGILCFFGAIVPQVRSMLPAMLCCLALIGWLVLRRYAISGLWAMLIAVAILGVVVYLFPQKFGYYLDFFSGENRAGTFDFRKESLWPQGIAAYQFAPWTGIGIEPRFAGFPGLSDNYVGWGIMDNQYYFALACGGIPALIMVIVYGVSSAVWPFHELKKKISDPVREQLMLAFAACCISIPIVMSLGNFFTNNVALLPLFGLFGAGLASREEYQVATAERLFKRYGRVRPVTESEAGPEARV